MRTLQAFWGSNKVFRVPHVFGQQHTGIRHAEFVSVSRFCCCIVLFYNEILSSKGGSTSGGKQVQDDDYKGLCTIVSGHSPHDTEGNFQIIGYRQYALIAGTTQTTGGEW